MVSLASDAHEAADAQPLLLERADHVGGRASLEGANLEQPVLLGLGLRARRVVQRLRLRQHRHVLAALVGEDGPARRPPLWPARQQREQVAVHLRFKWEELQGGGGGGEREQVAARLRLRRRERRLRLPLPRGEQVRASGAVQPQPSNRPPAAAATAPRAAALSAPRLLPLLLLLLLLLLLQRRRRLLLLRLRAARPHLPPAQQSARRDRRHRAVPEQPAALAGLRPHPRLNLRQLGLCINGR